MMEDSKIPFQELMHTAKLLVADGKGLLAMDESYPTCNKRFAKLGIPQTAELRRDYRELIVTTAGLNESISGAILFDETVHQQLNDGNSFITALTDNQIIPGIKVDGGTVFLPGHPEEKITEGLDNLQNRLKEYAKMGLKFAKWRAVFTIGKGLPTQACIESNASILAQYAAMCQQEGIVPIVEPEVLMDGDHTMARCFKVTEKVLHAVFNQLFVHGVLLEGMILKPNMILPGLACENQKSVEEVADATIKCLLRTVPAAVPGIAFLSGGQSSELASARLNAMNVRFNNKLPWEVSFSFGRAIQEPAMDIWHGNKRNVTKAQEALYHRAICNRAARQGKYNEKMESK